MSYQVPWSVVKLMRYLVAPSRCAKQMLLSNDSQPGLANNPTPYLQTPFANCSARVIPGNEKRVVKMLNSIAAQGASVVQGRSDNLHVSGEG